MTAQLGDPEDLDLRWRALTAPAGDRLAAERVRSWAAGPVLVALDAAGARHLLIRIDDVRRVTLPRSVAGLTIRVRHLHPAGQSDAQWIDLVANDASWHRTFSGLCAEIVAELPSQGEPNPDAVVGVLERWRRFWETDRSGLSTDEQTGLIGELIFLLEWLPTFSASVLRSWLGPLRGRHDFVTGAASVEVKATRSGTGPVVHRVASLDQLDEPGDGGLFLFSLRTVPDPLGEVSLDDLLRRLREAAQGHGPECVAIMEERLLRLRVKAADAGRYTERVRITQQELFEVHGGFPRLTSATFPQGLPGGVVDVGYSIDTSACQQWLVARRPSETRAFEEWQ